MPDSCRFLGIVSWLQCCLQPCQEAGGRVCDVSMAHKLFFSYLFSPILACTRWGYLRHKLCVCVFGVLMIHSRAHSVGHLEGLNADSTLFGFVFTHSSIPPTHRLSLPLSFMHLTSPLLLLHLTQSSLHNKPNYTWSHLALSLWLLVAASTLFLFDQQRQSDPEQAGKRAGIIVLWPAFAFGQ